MYEVLTTQVNDWVKPPALKGVSRDLLGDHSLLLAEGEMHRIQRKALQPAFTSGHIDSLASLFARKGVELASKVKEEGINMEVDVAKYITAATLDTIGLATFSQDFGALQDPNNELAAALQLLFDAEPLQTIVDLLATRLPKWLLSCLPYVPSSKIVRYVSDSEFHADLAYSIVAQRQHTYCAPQHWLELKPSSGKA